MKKFNKKSTSQNNISMPVNFITRFKSFFSSKVPFSRNTIAAAFFVLVIIRLLLSLLPQCKVDPGSYIWWANLLNQHDFNTFYKEAYYCIYGPVYLYLMWFSGKIAILLGITDTAIPSNYYAFGYLLKLWYVMFDFLAAGIIFKLGRLYNKERIGALLAGFYVMNPGIFINSSVWGQLDTMIATMMLAVIYLLNTKRKVLAALVFTVAVLTKPQAGIIAPVVMVVFFLQMPWKTISQDIKGFLKEFIGKTSLAALLCILFYAVTFLPFYNAQIGPVSPHDPNNVEIRDMSGKSSAEITADFFTWLPQRYLSGMQQFPYATANGFSFWFLAGGQLEHYDTPLMGATYKFYGTLILGVSVLVLIIFLIKELLLKRRKSVYSLYFSVYVLSVVYATFYTRVAERYLLPSVIFATVCIFWNKKFIILTSLVSLCTFVNQYYIYSTINKNPERPWLAADDRVGLIISALTVILALYSVWLLICRLAGIGADKKGHNDEEILGN